MNVFVPYLAALHRQDLLEQAELARRAKLFADAAPSVPAWRRRLGGLLASAARALDSDLVETPVAAGHGGDALPAC